METLLLLLGIIVVTSILLRPPRTQIVYVPVEQVEARGELGCLPLIVMGILALVALGVVQL